MRLAAPDASGPYWLAADRHGDVEVRFVGRGPGDDRETALKSVGADGLQLAWVRQIHSGHVLDGAPGDCGEGDALVTDRRRLALSVLTADCVPVVLADGTRIAVVHAGWRGIAAEIVPAALERFDSPERVIAWLGPAIGPCCYEVGDDVARRVVSVSAPGARVERGSGRPHLDLHSAIESQLAARGVEDRRAVADCTRCHSQALASYRRDGARAGRNLTFAWRS